MNEKFRSFWSHLIGAAGKRSVPMPTESETQLLADRVLRELRQAVPDPAVWWTPLARRTALAALIVALVSLGFFREAPEPGLSDPGQLAAAFLNHELRIARESN